MVEQAHADRVEGGEQPAGEVQVLPTGSSVAARVVVREQHGTGVERQHVGDDQPYREVDALVPVGREMACAELLKRGSEVEKYRHLTRQMREWFER